MLPFQLFMKYINYSVIALRRCNVATLRTSCPFLLCSFVTIWDVAQVVPKQTLLRALFGLIFETWDLGVSV